MAKDSVQIVAEGSFEVQQTHELPSVLDVAIAEYEAAANTIAVNIISDHKVRQQYVRHIKELSDRVRQHVASGDMSVKEGAQYCSQLRDGLLVEYRKYTSSLGLAVAEKLKPAPRGIDYYLNKYAQAQFGKDFAALSAEEQSAVYYRVLNKAGEGNTQVTTKVRYLQAGARVMLVFTAMLATAEIIEADDKIREITNQGSIIAGGLIGGAIAGASTGWVCGPAAPACALVVGLIGSTLGAWGAKEANDLYQDELPVFMHWLND